MNYKSGMKKGEYSDEREQFEKDIKEAVKGFASSQPVIVIVEDEKEAISLQQLLYRDLGCSIEMLTEISKIGEIRGRDMHYQSVKTTL